MKKSKTYLRPELVARISSLGLRANRVVEGAITGQHRSSLQGLSPEFTDYREYVPGDDLKNLDWRAHARTERYYIKRFEDDSNLRAAFVIDRSKSMSYGRGGFSKYDCAATLTAALSALLLKQRDAVGLFACHAGGMEELRPKSAQSQLAKVLAVLESTQPEGETDLGGALTQLAERLRRRGLVVVLSDLLTPLDALYDALGKLQYGGQEILIFHILDEDEIELPFNDSVVFRDLEGEETVFAEPWAFRKAYRDAMRQFIEDVQSHCRFCGIDYRLLKTNENLETHLVEFLNFRLRRADNRHSGRMKGYHGKAG